MSDITIPFLLIFLCAIIAVCSWAILHTLEEVRMELTEIRSLLTALADELIKEVTP
jgi:hypothetical protein